MIASQPLKWAMWPLGLVCVALLSLKFGASTETFADVLASFGDDPQGPAHIIATYRVPRIAAALLVGVHFALAGLIMQIVLRNPLADPTIFGISGGASLAVVLSMTVMIALHPPSEVTTSSTNYVPIAVLPYIALAGGLLAAGLVFWLSWDRGFSVPRMTLIGVITGAVLSAFVMAMILAMSESNTELAILWLAGSLYGRSVDHIWPVLPWTALGLAVLLLNLRQLSILRFDSASARAIGVQVGLVQPLLILVAVALAASAVSVAGPVGFVGLLVPYIARIIGRHSLAYQIWISMFIGAGLVAVSDTLGRMLIAPSEIPVGIVTSLIGAPAFALILNRREGKN